MSGALFDGRVRYRGYHGSVSECLIRVFDNGGVPVVVATELEDNPGTSITNAAETLATDVWEGLGQPTGFCWIEHYDSGSYAGKFPPAKEEFDLVSFDEKDGRLVRPRWRRIPKEEAESLCGSPL